MDKRSIKESIKARTFFRDTVLYLLMKMGFFSNYTRGLITMDRTYFKLKKRYEKRIKDFKINEKAKQEESNFIWICWFQGIEKAPELVKKCYKSVKKWYPDNNIVLITKENFKDYTNIPEYIIRKWEKGIISNTHFSDILRASLLIENGGLWLDATVWCTGNSWNKIKENKLFVYRNGWMDMEYINMASWLIYSKSNNNILLLTQELLYEYWKKNNYLVNYFLFHIFFKMATEKYEEEWKQVPYYSQIDNHLLTNELMNNFDEKRYNEIKSLTNFHKLTYKLQIDKNTGKTTFYDKIIEE